jgi:hypothetical protein
MTPGVGQLPMMPAQGVQTSARLHIVVPPKPSAFNASKSRVMPLLLMLPPIQNQYTCGRAAAEG